MDTLTLATLIVSVGALATSLLSIVIAMRTRSLQRVERSIERLREIAGTRRYRRMKRYVLLRVVCFEDVPIESFVKELVSKLYNCMGIALRARCGLALAAYRPDLGRAILRVSGDPQCLKFVLLTLSLRHFLDNVPCIAIPLRTSGLLTRLRKYLRVYR